MHTGWLPAAMGVWVGSRSRGVAHAARRRRLARWWPSKPSWALAAQSSSRIWMRTMGKTNSFSTGCQLGR